MKEGLASPEGVDVGADGRVYVAEAGAGRLIAFDPKDNTVVTLAEGLKTGLPAVEGMLPAYLTTGVAVSRRDGSIYVSSDITNSIYRIAPQAKWGAESKRPFFPNFVASFRLLGEKSANMPHQGLQLSGDKSASHWSSGPCASIALIPWS